MAQIIIFSFFDGIKAIYIYIYPNLNKYRDKNTHKLLLTIIIPMSTKTQMESKSTHLVES